MPRVSVVVPARNAEALIEPSLHSVLRQTWRDLEVLVVDDGSSDRTAERAASLGDRRLRVIGQPRRGAAAALNAGIRRASGQYVGFLDAGDRWHPEKLARHVAHLASRAEVGVSYSQSAFIDAAGRPLGYLQTPQLRRVRARDVFLRNPVGNGSAALVRRPVLEQIARPAPEGAGGERWVFDERLAASEDVECWTRIALTTRWRFEGLAEPLTLFRADPGGVPSALDRQLASWEQVVRCVGEYAPFFVHRWAPVARGYQRRYLARRALREARTAEAWWHLGAALWQHPALLLADAPRTWSTLGAATLQALVPAAAYARAEALAMRWATRLNPRVRGG